MEALVNVDSSLICARIIQVFVGALRQLDQKIRQNGSKDV